MKSLSNLQPQPLWKYFFEICQIPRPSKKEDKIRQYLLEFADSHGLQSKTDEVGNVLIKKPAMAGKEKIPTVVLQSHMDMVCEKNSDLNFNFEKDPIIPVIDGDWVKAEGTTLGADNGIGVAAQLAVLSATDIEHGPVECLFTVDEESGMTGAFGLKPGFFEGKTLINLDSEDDGEIFIGCAGGMDTVAHLEIEKEKIPGKSYAFRIIVRGLWGGHSGDDINKGRGNAIKILTRFLWRVIRKFGVRIALLDGGNLRNAIAREAYADIIIPAVQKDQFVEELRKFASDVEFEYERTEPNLVIDHNPIQLPKEVLTIFSQEKLLNLLYACPHGVLDMSTRLKGIVETSTNLASVKVLENNMFEITTSQRSELESKKQYAGEMVRSVFEMAGATVMHSHGYPGWTPNPGSKLLKVAIDSYRNMFEQTPLARSIHAGLECGLFLEKYPDLDMVSIGPTIKNAHSPDERVKTATVNRFWSHLVSVLKHIPQA